MKEPRIFKLIGESALEVDDLLEEVNKKRLVMEELKAKIAVAAIEGQRAHIELWNTIGRLIPETKEGMWRLEHTKKQVVERFEEETDEDAEEMAETIQEQIQQQLPPGFKVKIIAP